MRPMRLPVLVLCLAAVALMLVGCDQDKRPTLASANASAATSPISSAASATVALPNFTALVKKEGPAVINISTTRKVRETLPFPSFPGLTPDDPFYEGEG